MYRSLQLGLSLVVSVHIAFAAILVLRHGSTPPSGTTVETRMGPSPTRVFVVFGNGPIAGADGSFQLDWAFDRHRDEVAFLVGARLAAAEFPNPEIELAVLDIHWRDAEEVRRELENMLHLHRRSRDDIYILGPNTSTRSERLMSALKDLRGEEAARLHFFLGTSSYNWDSRKTTDAKVFFASPDNNSIAHEITQDARAWCQQHPGGEVRVVVDATEQNPVYSNQLLAGLCSTLPNCQNLVQGTACASAKVMDAQSFDGWPSARDPIATAGPLLVVPLSSPLESLVRMLPAKHAAILAPDTWSNRDAIQMARTRNIPMCVVLSRPTPKVRSLRRRSQRYATQQLELDYLPWASLGYDLMRVVQLKVSARTGERCFKSALGDRVCPTNQRPLLEYEGTHDAVDRVRSVRASLGESGNVGAWCDPQ